MRILHTADWHIGQLFFSHSREKEHIDFLSWLRDILIKEKINLLLICGDIFNLSNPGASSVRLFYSFLRDVTQDNKELSIVIIAGNHDSPSRIETPIPLLEGDNVFINGVVKKDDKGDIILEDLIVKIPNIDLVALAIPYLRQGDTPKINEINSEEMSYAKGVENLYNATLKRAKEMYPLARIIAMGHLQAMGGDFSNGDKAERSVIIGTAQGVSSKETFSNDIIYTALGHLHKEQIVGGNNRVRYSGSPLPMSFSEKKYQHGILIIDIDKSFEINVNKVIYPSNTKLISIKREALEEALEDISNLETLLKEEIKTNSEVLFYLEVRYKTSLISDNARTSIENAIDELISRGIEIKLAGIHKEETIIKKSASLDGITPIDKVSQKSPLEICEHLFSEKNGEVMSEELRQLLESVVKEVEEEESDV